MKKSKKRTYSIERNYEPVGAFLKAARSKAGLTQLEVANSLGYSSPQFISNFEAGIAVPPLKKLVAMEQIYGFKLMELMKIILDLERTSISPNLKISKHR